MAMGLPVLHGVEGESARIVEQEGVGAVFEPGNGEELARRVMMLAENKRKLAEYRANCIAAAPKYDRTNLASLMLAELEVLAQRATRTNAKVGVSASSRF
jgi:glycosyltransferase involved in cell wall biosynthesis